MPPTVSGLDVSGYQPRDLGPLIAEFQPEHVVVKLYLPQEVVAQDHSHAQIASARSHGCSVGGYVFCYRDLDPRQTVRDALSLAQDCGLRLPVLWLDAEPYQGSYPDVAWLREAVGECWAQGVRPGVYTGAWFWRGYLGDPHAFADLPLWLAQYDGDPQLGTSLLFGGWERASGKQWTSTPVDRNTFLQEVTTGTMDIDEPKLRAALDTVWSVKTELEAAAPLQPELGVRALRLFAAVVAIKEATGLQ